MFANVGSVPLSVSGWNEIIGENTGADAIPDRLVHDAHGIELMGESLELLKKKVHLSQT